MLKNQTGNSRVLISEGFFDIPTQPPQTSIGENNQQTTPTNQDKVVNQNTPFIVSTGGDLPSSIKTEKKPRNRRKIIATILGMMLLIGGLGTGVYLTQQTQNIKEKAARPPDLDKCEDIYFKGLCNEDGTCRKPGSCLGCCRGKPSTPSPNSSNTRPDLCLSATVDKNKIKPGETITITSKSSSPANYFMYAVYNMDNLYDPPPENNPKPVCVKDGGDITTAQDICPPGSHLLIFEDPSKDLRTEGKRTIRYEDLFVKDELTGNFVSNVSITAYFQKEGEPISVPKPQCVVRTISREESAIEAECLDVKAYSKDNQNRWVELDQNDLSNLKAGDTVYFTVTGKSKETSKFTKAKFKINNDQEVEVEASTNTKTTISPEEIEIFYEYRIPTNQKEFYVKAAIYHKDIGWIGNVN
jgi:plastocyanin